MKRSLIIVLGLMGALAPCSAQASHWQSLWKIPLNVRFENIAARPDGRIGVYWSPRGLNQDYHLRRTLLAERNGQVLDSKRIPGTVYIGTGTFKECWDRNGNHAYLPQTFGDKPTWIHLRRNGCYVALKTLPRFTLWRKWSLQDLRFSRDGKHLLILGRDRLWKVEAQTGKVLRVTRPTHGNWSRENAVLSPDGHTILGMRNSMTLFSTRTGHIIRRFGVHLETLTGGCGDMEARVGFRRMENEPSPFSRI